jgi:hypothetical protein
MKQLIQWIGIVSVLSLLGGCSTPAYVVKDDSFNPGSVHTYMWVDTRASENDDSRRATAFADISVHNAVNAQLQQWGWKEVSSDPEVMISYDVLVERTTETNRDPVYTQPMVRYYYNVYRKRWTPIYYPSQFVGYQEYETPVKEGTVTITIVDARSDKKLWQGWTTERLSGSGIDDADVRRSVRNIFKEAGV